MDTIGAGRRQVRAVLFDRDDTLIHDVPYLADPAGVRPVAGARQLLDRLRERGVAVGVVSNQSGVARGLITPEQLREVNARVAELLGPFDTWQVCVHGEGDGCDCRKPAPGMVLAAARELGLEPADCLMIGDIGADVGAGLAAGAQAVLVPTARTRPAEIAQARVTAAVAGSLAEAVALHLPELPAPPSTGRVLVARLDSMGDVLLAGPAVRAVAETAAHVTLLVRTGLREVAELLPGVDAVLEFTAPWVVLDPPPLDPAATQALVHTLAAGRFDAALVLTSYHQSPLPLALLLRMAGVGWVGAASEDYPGSLLDLRHRPPDGEAEAVRALGLARAAGFGSPASSARLALAGDLPDPRPHTRAGPYVVLHPGAAVPARATTAEHARSLVEALTAAGHRVVVTGGRQETALTAAAAGADGVDLGGRLTLRELAGVLGGARAVVAVNTGPAHLAAAAGAPVVSLFAPVVDAAAWAPTGVPVVVLGDQHAPCRGTRARICPVPGHPCLTGIAPADVVDAVARIARQVVDDVAVGVPA